MISDYLESKISDISYSLRVIATNEVTLNDFYNKTYIYNSKWYNKHLLYQLSFRLEVLLSKQLVINENFKQFKEFYVDIVITSNSFSMRKLITKTNKYYTISSSNYNTTNFLNKTKLVDIINNEITATLESIKQVESFINDNLY